MDSGPSEGNKIPALPCGVFFWAIKYKLAVFPLSQGLEIGSQRQGTRKCKFCQFDRPIISKRFAPRGTEITFPRTSKLWLCLFWAIKCKLAVFSRISLATVSNRICWRAFSHACASLLIGIILKSDCQNWDTLITQILSDQSPIVMLASPQLFKKSQKFA